MKLIIGILFLPFFAIGQITFTGTVVNKTNGSKVPYATVGLMKENIGVNADENGFFILRSIHSIATDSLIISSVGFINQKIAITNDLNTKITVQLVEQITTLNEVLIIPNYKWTNATLNNFSDCGNEFVGSSGYLQQVAQHFVAPKDHSRLTSIKICKSPGYPRKAYFRIRVYDIDTLTGTPGKDLCDKIIEVRSGKNLIKIKVEDYKIMIPNKDFFVAVEWLKIPYNQGEITHRMNAIQVTDTIYGPAIGWKDITGQEPEAWQLNYNSIWRPLAYSFLKRKSLFIAAVIKY